MSRSTSRLNAIAALRAPTIATTIHTTVRHGGIPRAASNMPRNANGSANSVCSILIISGTVRRRAPRPEGAGAAGLVPAVSGLGCTPLS